jgi:putative NADPH-quinone reductase
MKNILVIYGQPVTNAFSEELLNAYLQGAYHSHFNVRVIRLNDLEFDMNFKGGYRGVQPLEPDLVEAQANICWADHLVFIYPNWWATYPALLKAFLDRTFLPGFAFRFRNRAEKPEMLLTGKSARVIVTMDTSGVHYRFVLLSPGHRAIGKGMLNFCGIRPVRFTTIAGMKNASQGKKQQWLRKVERLGRLAR